MPVSATATYHAIRAAVTVILPPECILVGIITRLVRI
jgi:hypothetical protein